MLHDHQCPVCNRAFKCTLSCSTIALVTKRCPQCLSSAFRDISELLLTQMRPDKIKELFTVAADCIKSLDEQIALSKGGAE
jgi:hypothetical protein